MGDSGTLWTVHLDKEMKPIGAPQQVPTGGRRFNVVQWNADGSGLVVVGGDFNIYRMPASGSDNPELVMRRPFYGGVWFAISRRSGRLAYSVMQKDTNIWRVDLKSKTPHPEPLIASTVHDVFPVYSPDGSKISFYTNRTGPNTEIWVADADGGNQRQLTSMNEGLTASARWSPDGRTIVFDSNSTGTYQIYTIPADGGKPRQMTSSPQNSLCGSFSRDGKWIYFGSRTTGREELWKMPAAGGTPVQITHNEAHSGLESLDGKMIYFVKGRNPSSLWAMPVAGGPEVKLVDGIYRNNFEVAPKGIYFMTHQNAEGTSELRFYSFARKSTSLIAPIGVPDYGFDLSPDGRFMAFAQVDRLSTQLMMIENFH
jgi:Tol biopolymer transport system component